MYAKSLGHAKQRRQSFAQMPLGITVPAWEHAGAEAKNAQADHAKIQQAWWAPQGGLQKFLVGQMLEVKEREQQRIAADLHDVLGQSLTMIKLSVHESVTLLAENEAGEASELLERLTHMVGNAIGELRQVIMNLRPAMLDDLGVISTLSWFFREFEAACRGVKVEKQFSVREDNIPASLRVTIFRIIQEATNNIVKHAHADCIRVGLKITGNTLHLSIEDNGDGFDPVRHGSGLGLLSMKERAEISGGRYVMKSAAGNGTRIDVSWQLDKLALASENQQAS
jgi:signal transduction histidine kinase